MTIRKVLVDQEYPDCVICGKVIEYGEEYVGWQYIGRLWTSYEHGRGGSSEGDVYKEIVMCKSCGQRFLDMVDGRLDELVLDIKEEISEA